MSQKTIVTLYRKRFRLSLNQLFLRYKFIIGLPIVGTYIICGKTVALFCCFKLFIAIMALYPLMPI
jgi:hypothetical protein